ncbi:MAG: hypothetical protein ACLFQX_12145 [Candidatus Kapaibacterium sp.]
MKNKYFWLIYVGTVVLFTAMGAIRIMSGGSFVFDSFGDFATYAISMWIVYTLLLWIFGLPKALANSSL